MLAEKCLCIPGCSVNGQCPLHGDWGRHLSIESACRAIHDRVSGIGGDEWQKRRAVAHAFGYEDAKFMRYLHETYGLHVADQVIRIVTHIGVKIPWAGLASEFRSMGMNESAIESMLNEAREVEQFALKRKQLAAV